MMACPAVLSGQDFLASALAHVDCQAQVIGSYGWGALANPGSPVFAALTSVLTIFVALFGIRLLLGYPMPARDVVGDVLKVGIVLTLATSWPAWRVVGYDLIIHGPDQIAQVIGAGAGLPGSGGDLASRLQGADNGLAALGAFGSGRLGVAQGDWFELGFARVAFLAGTLGPLVLIRLMAGFCLAIAPLVAGLLLFGITRGIFEGWARALVAAFLASVMLSLVLGVELALLEPWLQDALQRRASEQQVLDAPVEVLVVTLSFAVVSLAATFLVARMAFHSSLRVSMLLQPNAQQPGMNESMRPAAFGAAGEDPSRALVVAHGVTENLRREERITGIMRLSGGASEHSGERSGETSPALAGLAGRQSGDDALGASWRRPARRVSGAQAMRDKN